MRYITHHTLLAPQLHFSSLDCRVRLFVWRLAWLACKRTLHNVTPRVLWPCMAMVDIALSAA